MERILQPELLDELPATSPDAIHSRRDLRRVNGWMGNANLIARAWPVNPTKQVVELGAGDGTLLLAVARLLGSRAVGTEAVLVDRYDLLTPETMDGFTALGWDVRVTKMDVFEWLKQKSPVDVVVANLFLHHFTEDQLRPLLLGIACRTKSLIACDPKRSGMGVLGVKLLPLIGCNPVTRHDALISVRAGFAGSELSSLWPDKERWKLREESANLFSHLFVAQRGT